MKVRYFEDPDTLYIELREGVAADTRDIDENTLVDIDKRGDMLAITVEHATQRAELNRFVYERVAD